MKASVPVIVIKNNTNQLIPLELFAHFSPQSNINGTTYAWNVCAQLFSNLTTVSVDYRSQGQSVFTTLTAPVTIQSLDGVLIALNTLGIGLFTSVQIAGVTYISVTSSLVYGSLVVSDNAPATSVLFKWLFVINGSLPVFRLNVLNQTINTTIFNSSFEQTAGGPLLRAGITRGQTVRFQGFFNPVKSGVATLSKNGCLLSSQSFSASGNWNMDSVFDRNDDLYSVTFNVP